MVDLTILNHSPTFTAAVSSSFRAGVVWVWVLAGGQVQVAELGKRPRGARQAADLSGGRPAERSGLAERGVRAGIASAGGRASVLSSVSGGAHLSIPLPIPL